jgi:indoleamine 2,3-dioxygenase
MVDIFSGIVDYYPENKLTEYLLDLRTYRPKCIQNFFTDLRAHFAANPLFKSLQRCERFAELVYLLKVVDEVYLFRNGHWQFVQKYIMANTKYAKATGGTPITSWLVNQIASVLEYERVILAALDGHAASFADDAEVSAIYTALADSHPRKLKLLNDQVELMKAEDFEAAQIFQANQDNELLDHSTSLINHCPHQKA